MKIIHNVESNTPNEPQSLKVINNMRISNEHKNGSIFIANTICLKYIFNSLKCNYSTTIEIVLNTF